MVSRLWYANYTSGHASPKICSKALVETLKWLCLIIVTFLNRVLNNGTIN